MKYTAEQIQAINEGKINPEKDFGQRLMQQLIDGHYEVVEETVKYEVYESKLNTM